VFNAAREEDAMQENHGGLFVRAARVGNRAGHLGAEASRLRVAASHAVEEKVAAARRLAKRSRHAAEDLVDEAAYRIKREPLRTVGLVFTIGLGLGALIGWLAGRPPRR
jgi:ElaB/YqjD/DUF883 family membrane-anchored ribosome-binding protein